ncbi:MAG: Dabb family protein, partial [Microthrixaceae bacterium]
MIRHVVLLEFDASTPDEHLELVVERLRELPSLVPAIRAYTVGRDLRLADTNAHLAVSGDFNDVDGYIAYRDDPAHRA